MERQWHIIPEYENIEGSLKLAEKYRQTLFFFFRDTERMTVFVENW